MTKAACYIVLNEEHYIGYSLESIYDFVDEIIIIHGSTQYAKLINSDGLSVDNTKKVIDEFIATKDKDKKIKYFEVGQQPTKSHLRNNYLNQVSKEIDWVFVVDGDEVFRKGDLEYLDGYLNMNPDLEHIFFPQYWFWGDFQTICEIDEFHIKKEALGKRALFRDRNGYVARQGEFHERLYRNGKGFMHRSSHSIVTDPKGRDVYINQDYVQKRVCLWDFRRFHYGYVKPMKNLEERIQYYAKRDKGLEKVDAGHDSYIGFLSSGKPQSKYYKIMKVPNLIHPEVMRKHPFYNKHVTDL